MAAVRRTGASNRWQDAPKVACNFRLRPSWCWLRTAKIAAQRQQSTGLILERWPLTITAVEAYIRPLGTPPLPRRVGASAKPLTDYSVNEHWAMLLVAMFVSPRRMGGVPGCLISESEERETWTAESLRAAFSNGEALAFPQESSGHGRDFGGLTFQGFLHRPVAQAIGRVGTSSNVVISRDQISST